MVDSRTSSCSGSRSGASAAIVAGPPDPDIACERVLIGRDRVAPPDPVLGPNWFVGTRLNFAENLLRYRDDREAIVFWNERGAQRGSPTRELLRRGRARRRRHCARSASASAIASPASCRTFPRRSIAMLAATSIGAIWSSCSPDFGVYGVLDRFGQIQPRVLFCADAISTRAARSTAWTRVREIAERIPEIERVVVVPYLRASSPTVVAASAAR